MSTDDDIRAITVSREAEQSVLGTLLSHADAFDLVADRIDSKHFADHAHGRIWSAAAGLAAPGRPVDVLSVFEVLRERGQADDCGGLEYLAQLAASSISSRNICRHAAVIVERYHARALLGAASTALEVAQGPGVVAEKVDSITSLFGAIQAGQVRKAPRAIADIAIERTQAYEDIADGKRQPGWRTHITRLTSMLMGGFRPGSLYVLAARPSVGKSSFAEELGLHLAADGLATLFLSLEMGEQEIADRAVSSMGRLSYSALLTGAMGNEEWSRASEALERLSKLPFYVDDQPAQTLRDIRLKAKSIKGLKVLVLDYLQLCAGARRDGNRNAEIEEISRGLKALAKELGIAVIALSQLNRDVEKRGTKRPMLSDLRDSGAIEQDSDVIMFLWPVREFEAEGRRVIGLGVDKNRQGPCGEVGLDFFGDLQQWSQSSADIRPTPASRKQEVDL